MKTIDYHLNNAFFSHPLEFEGLRVVQIGRMFCTGSTVIKTHMHLNHFEITVVTDGEGLVYANDVPTHVRHGDIYLSLPCESHRIESDPEKPLKFDFFSFIVQGGCFEEVFEQLVLTHGAPTSRVIHDERIKFLVGNAIAEIDENNNYKHELLNAMFRQTLIYISRGFQHIQPTGSANISHAESLCYKLMNYIDTHIYTIKSLHELAQITDYSYGYLSMLFRKTTSGTLSDYFQRKKLETARQLLLEKKLTITNISELLNYSSVYAFSKAFRNFYGISPKSFAKQ